MPLTNGAACVSFFLKLSRRFQRLVGGGKLQNIPHIHDYV